MEYLINIKLLNEKPVFKKIYVVLFIFYVLFFSGFIIFRCLIARSAGIMIGSLGNEIYLTPNQLRCVCNLKTVLTARII